MEIRFTNDFGDNMTLIIDPTNLITIGKFYQIVIEIAKRIGNLKND
jgi:hypothetical protein